MRDDNGGGDIMNVHFPNAQTNNTFQPKNGTTKNLLKIHKRF